MVVTHCQMNIYDDVTVVNPDCFESDDWTRITAMFNLSLGEGKHRTQEDIVGQWMDLKEKITWFNRWYHHLKNMYRYPNNDEDLLEMVKDHYILENEGSDFEYEDAWILVKNNKYFMQKTLICEMSYVMFATDVSRFL